MLGSLVLITQDSLAVRLPEELPGLPVELPDKLFLIRAGWGAEEERKNRHRNKKQAGDQEGGQETGLAQGDLFNQRLKPGP